MEIDAKTEKWLGGLAAVGAGFLGWEREATAKFAFQQGYSLFSKSRFADALAGMIGQKNTHAIFKDWNGSADFHPNPMGWINQTVGIGIAIKIGDEILKRIWPVYERDLDAVPEVVRGISTGLIAGGALGGIFDPDVGYTATSTGGQVAINSVPFSRGEGGAGRSISIV